MDSGSSSLYNDDFPGFGASLFKTNPSYTLTLNQFYVKAKYGGYIEKNLCL